MRVVLQKMKCLEGALAGGKEQCAAFQIHGNQPKFMKKSDRGEGALARIASAMYSRCGSIAFLTVVVCLFLEIGNNQAQASFETWGSYNFDDCTAADSSGNGRHGVIHGTTCLDINGGKYLQFNNANNSGWNDMKDWVTLPNFTGSSLVFKARIKWQNANNDTWGWAAVWSIGDNSTIDCLALWVNDSGKIFAYHSNVFTPEADISDGTWHNVEVVTTEVTSTLYVDGVLIGATPVQKKLNFNNSPHYLSMHQWYNGGSSSSRFYGGIDSASIEIPNQSPGFVGRISQTPMIGRAGETTFTRHGEGFTPNSTVTLHSLDSSGNLLSSNPSLETDAYGDFHFTFTAPADWPDGVYSWWVVDNTTGTTSQLLGCTIFSFPDQSTALLTGPGSLFVNLPPIVWHEPYGELISKGDFDPTKDTFVIIHGWNMTASNDLPEWVSVMGRAIHDKSSAQGANVFYWNWQEKAKTDWTPDLLPDFRNSCVDLKFVPTDETEDSGINMVLALTRQLPLSYDKNIHFIGHSLGSMVSTSAAKFARKMMLPFADKIKHLTWLDPPCYGGAPGGKFISNNKDSLFVDNYMSHVAPAYKDIDANVWLTGVGRNIFPIQEWHSYARYWYLSSVTNFSTNSILGDSSIPEGLLRLGFAWWDESNQEYTEPAYTQSSDKNHAYWNLFMCKKPRPLGVVRVQRLCRLNS